MIEKIDKLCGIIVNSRLFKALFLSFLIVISGLIVLVVCGVIYYGMVFPEEARPFVDEPYVSMKMSGTITEGPIVISGFLAAVRVKLETDLESGRDIEEEAEVGVFVSVTDNFKLDDKVIVQKVQMLYHHNFYGDFYFLGKAKE